MLRRLGLPAAIAVAASTILSASTPTFWTVSTQADFLKGDVTNLSIDADGRVFLGPETSQIAETSAVDAGRSTSGERPLNRSRSSVT